MKKILVLIFLIFLTGRKLLVCCEKILTKAEKIVKNAWHYTRACVFLYRIQKGIEPAPKSAQRYKEVSKVKKVKIKKVKMSMVQVI